MHRALRAIWNSKRRLGIGYLLSVSLFGAYLYYERPNVSSEKDLIEIKGKLERIDKVSIRLKRKFKSSERDSVYHVHLIQYPCKFQVSYISYDKMHFYKNTKVMDEIRLHIAYDQREKLHKTDERIRSFSLAVNDRVYVAPQSGLYGFGKGWFELGLIIIPLIINALLVRNVLMKEKQPPTKPKAN